MITTIIFDMDGVIINSEPIHFEIERSILHEFGVIFSLKEYNGFVGTTSDVMWAKLIDTYKLSITVDEAIQRSKENYHYIIRHTDQPKLIEGTIALIKDLKRSNCKIVLASSSKIENIEIVLQKHQIKHYFDHIIGGDQVTNGKPDPEIFLQAAKLAKTLPSQCLVIEDSRNGVIAAKAAGMKCIGYKNPDSGEQFLYDADLIVTDIGTLRADNIFEQILAAK